MELSPQLRYHATKMIHKQSEMRLTQVRMPDDLTGSVFLSQACRHDDVRTHESGQSFHNYPGLALKSLHAPSAGNCSLRARLTIMVSLAQPSVPGLQHTSRAFLPTDSTGDGSHVLSFATSYFSPRVQDRYIPTNFATLPFSPSQTTQSTDSKTEHNLNTDGKEHTQKTFPSNVK